MSRSSLLNPRQLILVFLIVSSFFIVFALMTQSVSDFASYGTALIFDFILVYASALWLGRSKAERRLLIYLILLAVFVRILGSSLCILMELGRSGYLLGNARKLDNMAWMNAYSNVRLSDIRYGFSGVVMFYTMCYKVFSPDVHRPLTPLILIAAAGGLTTAFTYAFAKEFWGESVGKIAGIISAITPEFAFHYWTHLRDPLTPLGLSMALLGVALIKQKKWNIGMLVGLCGVLEVMFFHPAFGMGTAVIYVMLVLTLKGKKVMHLATALVVVALLTIFAQVFAQKGLWKTLEARNVLSGQYIIDKIDRTSTGEAEKQFDAITRSIFLKLPRAISIPAQIVYSMCLPYLAIGCNWGSRGLWFPLTLRALGWQIVLPFLIWGIILAMKRRRSDMNIFVLSLASIFIISVPAVMNMGEIWDTTRYRSFGYPIFSCLISYAMVYGWERPKPLLQFIFLSQLANVALLLFYKVRGVGSLTSNVIAIVALFLFFFVWHRVLFTLKRCGYIKLKISSDIPFILFGAGIIGSAIFFLNEITGIGISLLIFMSFLILGVLLSLKRV